MVDLRLWIGVESSVRSFRVRRETDYDNVSWVRSCPNSIIIPWDGLGTVRGMSHPEPVQTSSKLPTWMYSPASAFLLSTSDLSVTLHTSHFYFWYWSPWPDAGSYWKVLFNKYVDYGTKSGIYKQRSGERKCDLHKYWNFFFFFGYKEEWKWTLQEKINVSGSMILCYQLCQARREITYFPLIYRTYPL